MASKTRRISGLVLAIGFCALATSAAVTVTVDPNTKYQTMEGFGAFGGMNPYWTDLPYHNESFLNLIVDTLGMTVNRMDLTAIEENPFGPRDWQVQVDFLKVLIAKHKASGEPFTLIASCWSPLAKYKINNNINGGRLIMEKVAEVGEYLASFIPKIKNDIGVDLYALGPQNEPNLGTGYASCEYNPYEVGYLAQATAAAIARGGYSTKVHFSDDSPWGGCWWPCLAYDSVLSKPDRATGFNSVLQNAGMTADMNHIANTVSLHYRNGNTEESALTSYGSYAALAARTGKNIWNTEFGNGDDTWEQSWVNTTDMYHMINLGFSMIVYWLYGPHSNPAQIGEGLLLSYKRGPKGFGAQAFSRYIRPGYVRIKATPTDAGMRTLAFTGDDGTAATVLLINNSGGQQEVTVNGTGLPGGPYALYRTGQGFNCVKETDYTMGQSLSIAPRQIVTLYFRPSPISRTSLPAQSGLRSRESGGHRLYTLRGALVEQSHGPGIYVRSGATGASRAGRATVEFQAQGR